MPYVDKNRSRQYHREWRAGRRALFMKGKKCVICGAIDNLEIDHINPDDKVYNISQIWGRRKSVREEELNKCQVLCHTCHQKKSIKELPKTRNTPRKERHYASKLNKEKVKLVQCLRNDFRWPFRKIAKIFGVHHKTIQNVVWKNSWR